MFSLAQKICSRSHCGCLNAVSPRAASRDLLVFKARESTHLHAASGPPAWGTSALAFKRAPRGGETGVDHR